MPEDKGRGRPRIPVGAFGSSLAPAPQQPDAEADQARARGADAPPEASADAHDRVTAEDASAQQDRITPEVPVSADDLRRGNAEQATRSRKSTLLGRAPVTPSTAPGTASAQGTPAARQGGTLLGAGAAAQPPPTPAASPSPAQPAATTEATEASEVEARRSYPSTLVGSPPAKSVHEGMIERARAQRGSYPAPPSWAEVRESLPASQPAPAPRKRKRTDPGPGGGAEAPAGQSQPAAAPAEKALTAARSFPRSDATEPQIRLEQRSSDADVVLDTPSSLPPPMPVGEESAPADEIQDLEALGGIELDEDSSGEIPAMLPEPALGGPPAVTAERMAAVLDALESRPASARSGGEGKTAAEPDDETSATAPGEDDWATAVPPPDTQTAVRRDGDLAHQAGGESPAVNGSRAKSEANAGERAEGNGESGRAASRSGTPRAQSPARAPRDDGASPVVGSIVVAAMLAFMVGGWYLTRGGYERLPVPETEDDKKAQDGKKAEDDTKAEDGKQAKAQPEPLPEPAAEAAAVQARSDAPQPKDTAEAGASPTAQPPAEPAPRPRADRKPPARKRSPRPAQPPTATPTPEPPPVLSIKPVEEAPEVPGGPLPDAPSKEDVQRALGAVRNAVIECAAGKGGVAELDLTVLGSGRVTIAKIGGHYAGTPEGSCMARAVRQAQFSPFKRDKFRIIYPMTL